MSETTDFQNLQSTSSQDKSKHKISLKHKIIFVSIAWSIGFLIAITHTLAPMAIALHPVFPVPLVGIITDLCGMDNMNPINAATVGWLIYLSLMTILYVTRGKIIFYLIWAILLIILVSNGLACRASWDMINSI